MDISQEAIEVRTLPMMHHTLKHGSCRQEFSRVLGLAMSKHDDIMLVPGNITGLRDHLEKLLGSAFAKRLLDERQATLSLPNGAKKTIHLASLSGCYGFEDGAIVLPWVPLQTVSLAEQKHPRSDKFYIPNDGPGTPHRAPGRDELSRYLSSYPRSKAV
ncbi:hypothetical protein [Pseudomonas sp. AG1028]|uniref:hypothetical protein n=1 Tax=Pseudomonas sp. AG1028 TaxID=2572911 RepID=UPI0011BD77B8|nr:hypothetical protein [Pseudomonas sp. AG1028]